MVCFTVSFINYFSTSFRRATVIPNMIILSTITVLIKTHISFNRMLTRITIIVVF